MSKEKIVNLRVSEIVLKCKVFAFIWIIRKKKYLDSWKNKCFDAWRLVYEIVTELPIIRCEEQEGS